MCRSIKLIVYQTLGYQIEYDRCKMHYIPKVFVKQATTVVGALEDSFGSYLTILGFLCLRTLSIQTRKKQERGLPFSNKCSRYVEPYPLFMYQRPLDLSPAIPPVRILSIRMFKPQLLPIWLSFYFFALLLNPSHCDIGTASHYNPPYTPTACYGNDVTQFPSSNLFAAAGERIWDNGAACGRQYMVKCISAVVPKTCISEQVIQVQIVDQLQPSTSRPSMAATTIFLSTIGFETIANSTATLITIEFQPV